MISALLGLALLSQNASTNSVSIEFRFATVQEVGNELAKQSGEKIVVAPDLLQQTIALKLTNRTLKFSLEAIASVLGCRTEKVQGQWLVGTPGDGRTKFDVLRRQAEVQEKIAYQQFVEQFRSLAKENPRALKKAADSVKTKVAELERDTPDDWRATRRQLLNRNRLLLEITENAQLLLASGGNFTAESLMAGDIQIVVTTDANELRSALDLGTANGTGLVSLFGVNGDLFKVVTSVRNPHGGIEVTAESVSIYSEQSVSEAHKDWPVGSEIGKVPIRELTQVSFVPFSQTGQFTPGECVAEASIAAKCDYVSTTDRAEAIQKPLEELSKWANAFIQQNGGAIGWKDNTLMYRHVRGGQVLLQTLVPADWKSLETANKLGMDPDLDSYARFLGRLSSKDVRRFEYGNGPLSSVSVQPILNPSATRMIGGLGVALRNRFFDHAAMKAEAIGHQAFTHAFLASIFRSGGIEAGRALHLFVESGQSLKGLQASCDVVSAGKVVVRELDGKFSTISNSHAEAGGKEIVGKLMDYRFRFGYSDAESAGVSYFLRVPISPTSLD